MTDWRVVRENRTFEKSNVKIDGINGDKILDRCRLYFRSSEERDDREDDSQGMNAWAHLVKKKLSVPELRCGFKGVLI